MQTPAARGLTAAELALAIEALRELCPATVIDAVALNGTDAHDDVLLVLQSAPDSPKAFLHIALGGPRARLTTTKRKFGKEACARGPGADLLQRELVGAKMRSIVGAEGERRCTFLFDTAAGERQLVVELFGARGLWLLCDQEGIALTMSRAVSTAVRTLRRGDAYQPPPPTTTAKTTQLAAARFQQPVLDQIDAHFTELDLDKENQKKESQIRQALERGRKKAVNKVRGIRRQLDNVALTQQMRATADLMLAYAHNVPRGATSMEVPCVDGDGIEAINLDPRKPVAMQANQLYDKARRLDDGRAISEQRLAESEAEVAELNAIEELLETPSDDNFGAARTRLQTLGLLTKSPPTAKPGSSKKSRVSVPFRRFLSAEGYPIFVGRNNNQNDELTMRYANGNDIWLHVGGGRPGSHVVIRLPKQKTASLETLLDAATLAVYYSKARGEPRIDVIYAYRKNIKKPKGLPAGAVVPSQTKTLTLLEDTQRLARLLDSAVRKDD